MDILSKNTLELIINGFNFKSIASPCNAFKRDFQVAIDPETGEQVSLFNPRVQVWIAHFAWSEDGISVNGQTTIGRATVQRLRMNRTVIMTARQLWVQAGWHPPR